MKSVLLMCGYTPLAERIYFECIALLSSTWFVFIFIGVSFVALRRWINKRDGPMIFLSLLSVAFSAQSLAFFDLSGDVDIELRKQLETSAHAGIISSVGGFMDVMSSEQLYLTGKDLMNVDCLFEGCELSIAQRLEVDYYITGRISRIDAGYSLALNLYETSSSRLIGSSQVWEKEASEILAHAQLAASDLFEHLDVDKSNSDPLDYAVVQVEKGAHFGIGDVDGHRPYLVLHQNLEVFQYEAAEDLACEIQSSNSCSSELPAQNLSFVQAVELANLLSKRAKLPLCYEISPHSVQWSGFSCTGWRLPTDLEWEYLAMGSAGFPYSGSGNVDAVASYLGNSGGVISVSGSKKPNGYGLYDMSGNVWEWVWPEGEDRTHQAIARGGSYADSAEIMLRKQAPIHQSGQGFGVRFVRFSR